MKAHAAQTLLRRAVDVEPREVRALLYAFAYFFLLLAAYYVLRPLRDEMGIAGGIDQLQWLFTATFVVMLCAVPMFGWAVRRVSRRRLVPVVYRFFLANLLLFFIILSTTEEPLLRQWTARAFFVWISVFNLFVVSVFWSLMADLFTNEQGRRLFGFVAAGGSAGALAGPSITALLAGPLGPINLLLVAALLLEAAAFCAVRLMGVSPIAREGPAEELGDPIGGGIWAGLRDILRSRYLIGICAYLLFYTATSTILYFEQAHIVAAADDDPAVRTRIFASIDLAVAALTILTQIALTGRLMRAWGVGTVLGLLPLATVLGFAALAVAPGVAVLIAVQSMRRAVNFALARPAREVLFTVTGVEQKYKSKNAIDTLIYRGGDAASGWLFAALAGIGLSLPAIAALAAPASLLWWWQARALGREQDRRATLIAPAAAH